MLPSGSGCIWWAFSTVCRTEKEMNRRKDMLANLKSKVTQMASTLNMSSFANRDSLLGPEIKPVDAMSRATGLDNYGVVGLQRQIMKGKFLSAPPSSICRTLCSFTWLLKFKLWWHYMKNYFKHFSQVSRILIYVANQIITLIA